MSSRKRLASIAAGIILTLGVALGTSTGIASAAPKDDYLYDLSNAGIGGPKDTLLSLGYGACQEAQQNIARTDSITHISKATALDKDDAAFLYDSATQFLCH